MISGAFCRTCRLCKMHHPAQGHGKHHCRLEAAVVTPQPHHSWKGFLQGHERLLHTKQTQAHGPGRQLSHGIHTLYSTVTLHLHLL